VSQRGLIYRIRQRTKNGLGYSPYSDILSVLAASIPAAQVKPRLVSSTSTAITLAFEESPDDGGARISSYELYASSNYFTSSPTYTKVPGYSQGL
jgi:hypothetical protein